MTNVDDFLVHYGKKGMKWGVVNDTVGSGSGSTDSATPKKQKGSPPKSTDSMEQIFAQYAAQKNGPPTSGAKPSGTVNLKEHAASEAALKAYVIQRGGDPALLKAKYGPADSKPAEAPSGFYQKHKTAINVGAGIAAAGLVAYGGHKFNQSRYDVKGPAEIGKIKVNSFNVLNAKIKVLQDYGKKDQPKKADGNFDPSKLPTDQIRLKAGTIIKRVSSENEKTPRANGFFGAFDPDDVERYKAILPTMWPMWGIQGKNGFVVNLRANQDVKAPSRKQAYDIYESMLRSGELPITKAGQADVSKYAKETYLGFTANWAGDQQSLSTSRYFKEVKKQGFNALIDENDAGSLSKNPMRFLDGTMFTTEPATILNEKTIKQTQINEAKKLNLIAKNKS